MTSTVLLRRAFDEVVGAAKVASGAILGNLRLEYEGRSQRHRARIREPVRSARATAASTSGSTDLGVRPRG